MQFERNAATIRPMLFACRALAALFSVVGAASVALIARRLYGRGAALVALGMWCFDPLVLGHGATANHDVPGAALLAATFLAYWTFQERPDGLRSALLGWTMGLAGLTRTTCLPVVLLWLGRTRRPNRASWLVSSSHSLTCEWGQVSCSRNCWNWGQTALHPENAPAPLREGRNATIFFKIEPCGSPWGVEAPCKQRMAATRFQALSGEGGTKDFGKPPPVCRGQAIREP